MNLLKMSLLLPQNSIMYIVIRSIIQLLNKIKSLNATRRHLKCIVSHYIRSYLILKRFASLNTSFIIFNKLINRLKPISRGEKFPASYD